MESGIWTISVIKNGYKIVFQRKPPLSNTPLIRLGNQTTNQLLQEQLQTLLEKGAIELMEVKCLQSSFNTVSSPQTEQSMETCNRSELNIEEALL